MTPKTSTTTYLEHLCLPDFSDGDALKRPKLTDYATNGSVFPASSAYRKKFLKRISAVLIKHYETNPHLIPANAVSGKELSHKQQKKGQVEFDEDAVLEEMPRGYELFGTVTGSASIHYYVYGHPSGKKFRR
jgi:hypothetical protein